MPDTLGAEGFTLGNALAVLLTTESLLFAAFALAVNLSAPTGRVRGWAVPGPFLAGAAVVALAIVAAGAATAWHDIFLAEGLGDDMSRVVIAISVVTAIIVQPILALLLAMGLRRPK
jgi:hypothetical protein